MLFHIIIPENKHFVKSFVKKHINIKQTLLNKSQYLKLWQY